MKKETKTTGRMCPYCHGNFCAWNCTQCIEGIEKE